MSFGTACGVAPSQEMPGSAASPKPLMGPSVAPGSPEHWVFVGFSAPLQREAFPGEGQGWAQSWEQLLIRGWGPPGPAAICPPGGVGGPEQPVLTAVTGRLLENFKAEEKPRFPSPPLLVEIKPETELLRRAEPPSSPLPE